MKKIIMIKRIMLTILSVAIASCGLISKPGESYDVEVTSVDPKSSTSYYCVYRIKSVDSRTLPKNHFLADCGKYKPGDRLSMEIRVQK